MKLTTLALLGAAGYYLYKKSKQPTVAILPAGATAGGAGALPSAPVATLSTNPAPQISPNMAAAGSPIATAVAPPTVTFGSLGGTCFSSKRGMGIF